MSFAATWMNLEIITVGEVSQTEKDKYMILLMCGIFKKYDTNDLIYKTEIDPQTQKKKKKTYGYQRRRGGGIN